MNYTEIKQAIISGTSMSYLSIDAVICLNGTGINDLPDGLSVDCYLYLIGAGITELPDGLSGGDEIYK